MTDLTQASFSDSYPDYDRVAPPNSYINAGDFASPEELADYLNYLHHNEEAYLSYFLWHLDHDWKEVA